MSIRSILTVFAAGLAFASAYTTPTGDAPEGNPISQPGLNSVVPVGSNYSITWDPTTDGTVSLILLKGPATDLKLVYPIAEKIENSGTYVWEPKNDLEPGTTGYGIQLIVDATGQYQYTTQFGISNDNYVAAPPAYGPSSSSSASAHPTGYGPPGTWSSTAIASNATATSTWNTPYGTAPASGYPAGNMTMVVPTGSMSVPSSLKTTMTMTATASSSSASVVSATSSAPTATGAAANVVAGFGGIAVAAGLAVFAL